MIISPQALLGLDQLKWMYKYAFPGEVILGALALTLSLRLLNFAGSADPLVEKSSEKQLRPGTSNTTAN
jgi:hypothetical protein